MFLRRIERRKNGKTHLYWSLVENKRLDGGGVVQRHVLYLGEINSSQAEVWRKAIEVFDADAGSSRTLALFPEDRCEVAVDDASVVRLRISELRLHRPRQWGACWLAGLLWRELQLDRFWAERLPASRKRTRWDHVLQVLVAYRLIEPAPGLDPGGVAAASRMVRQERHGRSAGGGFRLGRDAQALCLPRPVARPQGRAVLASDGALARSVQRQFRRAALRSDQHLLRGQRLRFARGRQAPPRLQPRQAAGLPATGDRAGRHARRPAAGLRGSAGQHRRQQDVADVSEQDRETIRQGAARMGDGSRRAHRGGFGRDARQRPAGAIPRRHAQGAVEPLGKTSDREALAEGARRRRCQIADPGRRTLRLRPERRSRRQRTRDAATAIEMAVGVARQTR